MGEPRKQGRLPKKYIIREFDKMPQIRLRLTRNCRIRKYSYCGEDKALVLAPGNNNQGTQEVVITDKNSVMC